MVAFWFDAVDTVRDKETRLINRVLLIYSMVYDLERKNRGRH